VAVEHQILATTGPHPAGDYVRPPFFDFLPRDAEVQLLERIAHVLGHRQFLPRGARNVDHVAAHRDELFFLDLGEDAIG